MLKNVEMGANFYRELGKLEKQLAKYQSKVLEIKTQMKEIKKQYSQAKKDENLANKYIPNDELEKDLLDIDNPNTTENFKPKNASEIWQFALNSYGLEC
uniref:R4 n=3 Tax=Helicobacter pylori TaxID=210 RepID=B5A866_HELPX|nr:unknown [Helicobacter pylori]